MALIRLPFRPIAGPAPAAPVRRPAPVAVKPAPQTGARWLARIGNALFAAFAATILVLVLALTVVPRVFEYQTYIVLTGSMEPTIPVGSVVIVIPVDPSQIKVGDIVSFTHWNQGVEPVTITHRVRRVLTDDSRDPSFETWGDANPTSDALPVRYLGQAGKVVAWVPVAGYFFEFARSPTGRGLLLTVPAAIFGFVWLWSVWKPAPARSAEAAVKDPGDEPQTAFQTDMLTRAYAILGDPTLTVERQFAGLRLLIKRAERAGEPELVTWLIGFQERLIDGDAAARPAPSATRRPARLPAPVEPRPARIFRWLEPLTRLLRQSGT